MKLKYLFLLIFSVSSIALNAQLDKTQEQKIDSLFTEWTMENHPGGAVGIMKDGALLYSKAFGLASLEYGIPNTVETIFNLGSVSKQLTAMGIVILAERGLLSVDDDIRKYLPEMPDFGHTITIRHMLHHTSGMRSLHAMLSLAGWRDDDSRTNDDLYRFMLKQRELNFVPGDEYLYCNTGYMLMVNIIERITGEKFPQWMKDNIFEPLEMHNTYVEDRYDRVVPHNATSYYDQEEEFYRAVEFWGYVGSGNVHSTTGDILKWLRQFSSPSPQWASAFEMLKTTDTLNDGSVNNYAFGVVVEEFHGYEKVQHGGAIGGFRAYASTYPKENLSITILTNFSTSNPSRIERSIAQILLDIAPENTQVPTEPPIINEEKIDLSGIDLHEYVGRFYSPELESTIDILLKDGQLIGHHARHGDFLIKVHAKDILEMVDAAKVEFIRNEDEIITGIRVSNGRARNVWFGKQKLID